MKRKLTPHLLYFAYVWRHKRYVFQAGRRLNVGFIQLITHDWTKYMPWEWFAYVKYFYTNMKDLSEFDQAWLYHQKLQPHHWQFWVVINDWSEPKVRALPMPMKYIREMVADWIGAGMAQGNPDVGAWYKKSRHKMIIHKQSRLQVEILLDQLGYDFGGYTSDQEVPIAA